MNFWDLVNGINDISSRHDFILDIFVEDDYVEVSVDAESDTSISTKKRLRDLLYKEMGQANLKVEYVTSRNGKDFYNVYLANKR